MNTESHSTTEAGSSLHTALRHGFFWMLAANAVGVILSLLLIAPDANLLCGEWTYGRWLPLHLNLHLFGWTSLPLVAWLFRVYRVDSAGLAPWARAAVWGWSSALLAGSLAWLNGQTSGKIFLDWSGRSLTVFTLSLAFLWFVLAWAWLRSGRGLPRLAGLLALALVPPSLYFAAQPGVYPPVNPESGGPTGASLLGSTLTVVFLLLLLPASLKRKPLRGRKIARVCWLLFAAQVVAFPLLERAQASHHETGQWLGLGLLLVWIPMLPAYFRRYPWQPSERRWLTVFLAWLVLLILSGWLTFLPGMLENAKFTHVLVAHSHLAMAGFTSTFLIFLAVTLLGGIHLFDSALPWWNAATGAYVALMLWAGWKEAADADWLLRGDTLQPFIFTLRLACGLVLLAVAAWWWRSLLLPIRETGKGGAA